MILHFKSQTAKSCFNRSAKSRTLFPKNPKPKKPWLPFRPQILTNCRLRRCYNKKSLGYKNYGGRGIKVCDRWRLSVENFFADMRMPCKGMSLDRIDNNGNYEPTNCRWADQMTQKNNKRQRKGIKSKFLKSSLQSKYPHINIAQLALLCPDLTYSQIYRIWTGRNKFTSRAQRNILRSIATKIGIQESELN